VGKTVSELVKEYGEVPVNAGLLVCGFLALSVDRGRRYYGCDQAARQGCCDCGGRESQDVTQYIAVGVWFRIRRAWRIGLFGPAPQTSEPLTRPPAYQPTGSQANIFDTPRLFQA
jgi:hypothetical protein